MPLCLDRPLAMPTWGMAECDGTVAIRCALGQLVQAQFPRCAWQLDRLRPLAQAVHPLIQQQQILATELRWSLPGGR